MASIWLALLAVGGMASVSGQAYTASTPIAHVRDDAVFGGYGRLVFPVDEGYMGGSTLGTLRLAWYNGIDSDETVKITDGAFMGLTGQVSMVDPDKGKLKVEVQVFGRTVPVDAEYWQVEKVAVEETLEPLK